MPDTTSQETVSVENPFHIVAPAPAEPEPQVQPEPVVLIEPPPPQAPQAMPSSPQEQEGKSIFDTMRGHAYNPFAIAGAASTVYDLIIVPSDIDGQKFAYISMSPVLGFAAFELAGGSVMMGLANSDPILAAFILGYANSAFGVSVEYSMGKDLTTTEVGNITTKTRVTYPGDNIGLNFSIPIGSATIYANAGWLTTKASVFRSVEGAVGAGNNGEEKADYSIYDASLGFLGNVGSLNYDIYINAIRKSATYTYSFGTNNSDDIAIDPDETGLETSFNFNIGYKAFQNETARLIAGFNNTFGIKFLDKVDGDATYGTDGNIMALIISPNILGEVVLFDNWLAFAGAMHDFVFVFGGSETDARNKNISRITMLQGNGFRNHDINMSLTTATFAGLRYQRTNWAVEAQVLAEFFNNPFRGFNGQNIFANFGGFIYF